MPQQAPLVSARTSPTRHWGSEDLDDGEDNAASQHIHFAPLPIMYVPGVYPVYPEIAQLPGDPFGRESKLNHEDLDQPSMSMEDHATGASTCSSDRRGGGLGLRHPRYSRRVQSKSEPSSSGTTSEDS